MPRFITLATLNSGHDNDSGTLASQLVRAEKLLTSESFGGSLVNSCPTLGAFDIVIVGELADADRAGAFAARLREMLEASTVTLTVLDAAQVDKALAAAREEIPRPATGR